MGAPSSSSGNAPSSSSRETIEATNDEPVAVSGWRAELSLGFTAEPGEDRPTDEAAPATLPTRLTTRAHRGPLVVQRPFFPEGRGVPHVYLLHPPGGIVGGDSLRVEVSVGPRAHALLTTPAATKVYRTRGPRSTQAQRLTVAAGAALEWLPQETILFDGAAIDLDTTVVLADGARFIGLETLCFGLPARGESFAAGRCRQRFELWSDVGRPLVIERGRFDAGDAVHGAPWGLGGARVHGLMVATPFTGDGTLLTRLREIAATSTTTITTPSASNARARVTDGAGSGPTTPTTDRAAVTVVGDGRVLCFRFVGASTERARRFFQEAWIALRPSMIGSPAVLPRIWAT
jgi:urease accessory protein